MREIVFSGLTLILVIIFFYVLLNGFTLEVIFLSIASIVGFAFACFLIFGLKVLKGNW